MKITNFLNQQVIIPHGPVKLMISVLFLLMIRRIVLLHLSLSLMMKLDLWNKKFHLIYIYQDQVHKRVCRSHKICHLMYTYQGHEDAQESLNESTGEPGSSSEPQGESIVKFSPIVLPRMKSTVQYLSNKDDKWKTVDIICRDGKATGKCRNVLNIEETDQIKSIDWKEEVKEWVPVNTEQVLMIGTKLQDLSVAEAKLKELQKWKNYEVYEEIANEGQRIISCLWVCIEKPTDNGTVIKARLVARGFKEESYVLCKDFPTCSIESLHLIFTIIFSNHWEVNSLDIQSAFLQGKSITRDIYLIPPEEADTEKLWKLKKCVYGLTDASRHWYLRFTEELSKLGVHKSIYDEAVFYWYFGNVLHGIICTRG